MKRVRWELIDMEILKSWAITMKFETKELDALCYHEQEIAKKEYYATTILERLDEGYYNSGIKEIPEGTDYKMQDKIDFPELSELHKDLFDFWIAAQSYWRSNRDLSMLNKPEKKELERLITELNNYIKSEFDIDSD